MPDAVNVGAVAAGHLTVGNVNVAEPALVKINVKLDVPTELGLVKVKVVVPLIVLLNTFPFSKLTAVAEPIATVFSE